MLIDADYKSASARCMRLMEWMTNPLFWIQITNPNQRGRWIIDGIWKWNTNSILNDHQVKCKVLIINERQRWDSGADTVVSFLVYCNINYLLYFFN